MGNFGVDTLIVDDEPLARNRLKKLCSRLENITRVRMASSGHEAIQIISQHVPDMLLLDVDMPDISGIEVAEHCRLQGKKPEIIFTTAHSRYAVRAFRVQAADFLLKPVKQALLTEAVERVKVRLNQLKGDEEQPEESYLWVREGDGSVQICCSDIGYITAERDYMRLCLHEKSHLVHGSMQSLVDALPNGMFVRIHRSTVVRRDFIQEVRRAGRRKYVVLRDGTDLTIGASYANSASVQPGGLGLLETVSE